MMYTENQLFKFMADRVNRALTISFIETTRIYSILPHNYALTGVAQKFCNIFKGRMCDFVISLFTDSNTEVDNEERYDISLSNLPAGWGYRALDHYAQLISYNEETFRRYDWGPKGNDYFYNQTTPPDYKLEKLVFPIAILAGNLDKVAHIKDVQWTYD